MLQSIHSDSNCGNGACIITSVGSSPSHSLTYASEGYYLIISAEQSSFPGI